MTDKIKGNPKACPYCKSSNFIHTGTGAFSHFSENSRHVIINKNFLCNECKKYFFSQDEADIPIGKEKGCNHNNLEKSYSLFYYPGTKTPYDGISVFFCTDCCCYLLTCNTIKSDLEEAWPDFWNYTWGKPFIYHAIPCKYCMGENFEDMSQEISHAIAKALVFLRKENNDLFKFLYAGNNSGIVNLEKEFEKESKEYFKKKYNWIVKTFAPKIIEASMDRRRKIYKKIGDKQKESHQYVRNARNFYREKFNLPRIGEGWISETKLFELVKKYFQDYKVYFHYRQSWLNGLELDIFVPDKNLAIEYMGKQHYEPVNFFGGKESYLAVVQRDKLKKELCQKNGINLVYFDYQTEVTKDNLKMIFEREEKQKEKKIL